MQANAESDLEKERIEIDSRSTGCLLITGSIATSVSVGLIYDAKNGLLAFGAICLGFALVGMMGHLAILLRRS